MAKKVSVAMVGSGSMLHFHLQEILKQTDTTTITVVCEPSDAAYRKTQEIFAAANLKPPPNQPDFEKMLAQYSDQLEVFSSSLHMCTITTRLHLASKLVLSLTRKTYGHESRGSQRLDCYA